MNRDIEQIKEDIKMLALAIKVIDDHCNALGPKGKEVINIISEGKEYE
jgi:hypothetical protein